MTTDRELLRALVKGGTLQGPGPWVPLAELDRAVRAENERCALFLEEWAQHYRKQRDPGMANHCQAMAKRIRDLAQAPPVPTKHS